MAESFQSDIFKFVALRPPVSIEKKNQETNYIADDRKTEETVVGQLTKSFNPKDGTKIPEQVKEFIDQNKFDLNYPESIENFTFAKIYEFLTGITKSEFNTANTTPKIEEILGVNISLFLDKNDNQVILNNLWDRYYAFYILARSESQNLDILTKNLRVFHFLKFIIQFPINNFDTIQNLLLATPLVSKNFTALPKPAIKTEHTKPPVINSEKNKEYKQLWTDLLNTYNAINEIKDVRFETKTLTETKNTVIPNKETGIEDKGKITFMKTVSKVNFGTLNQDTKSILKKLNLGENNFKISETVSKLQEKLQVLHLSVANINDAEFITQMPPEAKLIPGISAIDNYGSYAMPSFQMPPTNIRSSIKPLGIGDLKVVKQKLKKYVSGEVAHIENVLRGEFKERKHRVLDRTEDIFTISNESSEETTKDTQTTERFELKNESEKTIQEKLNLEAGITVSGSYGMVKFSAHGDMAYSKSAQESNKNSSNFAREVIDKSVTKIQKKTKEERTTKKLHEVEEINNHGIDNKDKPDHAVGIYRWVDKYYDAQIYNYGKRMMFEFIIPEPSAFFEFAQAYNVPKKNITAPKLLDKNLTHKEITEYNYNIFIRDYNVQGVTTPPVLYKTVSTAIVKDGMPLESYKTHTANSKELIVPDGYIAKFGVLLDCTSLGHGGCKLKINIGNIIFTVVDSPSAVQSYDYNSDDKNGWHWFYPGSIIQISVNSYDITSYTINALVLVERMPETYENWQIQTFGKIQSAYQAMQIEYEQKIASQEVQNAIAIHGQNPGINREIEKTELKKQCVKMLMDTTKFGTFDSMKQATNDSIPDFDIFDALEEGKTIQFYEQAFEWENLTYLFYPYFWSRSDQWIHKINTYDTDPLFTKFLQAGSARVVIPVHPAYNDAVMYFLENNGTIWQGGEPPRLNDPLFLSLADELRGQTDDLENATPEGKSWEVILPTTLVYLQQDSVLPSF